MGKAIFDTLCAKKLYEVVGCGHGDNVGEALKDADMVVLAVKPQVFDEVAGQIVGSGVDLTGKLVVSIMAGIGIEKMTAALKTAKIVRTFPNLALKVNQSLTLWKAGDGVSEEEKVLVREILVSFGQEIEVEAEDQIGVIGVVSGCGPGFLAYFGEKMAEFLVSHGVEMVEAEKVARQTLIGTGEVVKKSGWNLTDMRRKVSSKGGLTEAGVRAMEEGGMGEVFAKGGEAALKRNGELSK